MRAVAGAQKGFFFTDLGEKKQKRIPFLKNKAEKLLKTKDRHQKTKRNKPKNKAEKLLKTRSCGKNKAKNKPADLVENKRQLKNEPETASERIWMVNAPPEGQSLGKETSHSAICPPEDFPPSLGA